MRGMQLQHRSAQGLARRSLAPSLKWGRRELRPMLLRPAHRDLAMQIGPACSDQDARAVAGMHEPEEAARGGLQLPPMAASPLGRGSSPFLPRPFLPHGAAKRSR